MVDDVACAGDDSVHKASEEDSRYRLLGLALFDALEYYTRVEGRSNRGGASCPTSGHSSSPVLAASPHAM